MSPKDPNLNPKTPRSRRAKTPPPPPPAMPTDSFLEGIRARADARDTAAPDPREVATFRGLLDAPFAIPRPIIGPNGDVVGLQLPKSEEPTIDGRNEAYAVLVGAHTALDRAVDALKAYDAVITPVTLRRTAELFEEAADRLRQAERKLPQAPGSK